jgi:hypothetical protein
MRNAQTQVLLEGIEVAVGMDAIAGDKAYDARGFVQIVRALGAAPKDVALVRGTRKPEHRPYIPASDTR